MGFEKKTKRIAMLCLVVIVAIVGTFMLNYIHKKSHSETSGKSAFQIVTPTPSPSQTPLPSPTPIPKIKVHIKGEVNNPGLYELNEGARLNDAVEAAGGFTKNAGTEYINLALKLCDEDEINIPSKSSGASGSASKSGSSSSVVKNPKRSSANSGKTANSTPKPTPSADNKININTAGAEELDLLPGIGPAYAKNIIDYRNKYGAFETIEDIMKVSGIGKKTV